jgi:hypothetical protein
MNDALPIVELAVTDTGRVTPTPLTNMTDMQESEAHCDTSQEDAVIRTAGLCRRVAKCLPTTATNIEPVAGDLERLLTAAGVL